MEILSPLVTLLRGTGTNNGGDGASDNDDMDYNNPRLGDGGLALVIDNEDN
jgi:hypothetical protein